MFSRLLFVSSLLVLTMNWACGQKNFEEKLRSLYKGTVPLIQPGELESKLETKADLVLLDIRSSEEYSVSFIESAQMVDYDSFDPKMVEHIDKKSEIVVYCSVGYRSERIGEKLQEMGFENVKNLYGGIFEWKNSDHQVYNTAGITDSVHTYNKNWSRWLEKGIKVYE